MPGGGDRYTYRFRGAKQTASLVIDTAVKTGWLELDGVREDCMAFGLYRR